MGARQVVWAIWVALAISATPSAGRACPCCQFSDWTPDGPVYPLVIRNPYVSWPFGTDTILCPARPAPLRTVNPTVAQPGDPGIFPDAVLPRQPQVVRPILLASRAVVD